MTPTFLGIFFFCFGKKIFDFFFVFFLKTYRLIQVYNRSFCPGALTDLHAFGENFLNFERQRKSNQG